MCRILGIETSCDDTCLAIVEKNKILTEKVFTQNHNIYGGIHPTFASREHLNKIDIIFKKIYKYDFDYIAVTNGPGLIGSLIIGNAFANGLSIGLKKKIIGVDHLRAHVYAAFVENNPKLPALALIVSGGHTSLLYVEKNHEIYEMGSTLDDAAGELFDKAARMMGFDFPGGQIIESLAKNGNSDLYFPKVKIKNYDFSFSGLKTHLYYKLLKKHKKEDIAASLQKNVVNILIDKIQLALKNLNVNSLIICGGVAANSELRKKCLELFKNISVFIPKKSLCRDNAVMVALAAYYTKKNKTKKIYSKANFEKFQTKFLLE